MIPRPYLTATVTEWKPAAGSCGFNAGSARVEGAYVNGVALYAWSYPYPCCVVTGHGSCGGATTAAAKAAGVRWAEEGDPQDADRRLSKQQFEAVMADPARHD